MTKADFLKLITDYPDKVPFIIRGQSGITWEIDLKKLETANIQGDKQQLVIVIK